VAAFGPIEILAHRMSNDGTQLSVETGFTVRSTLYLRTITLREVYEYWLVETLLSCYVFRHLIAPFYPIKSFYSIS
jgi:hypothetical protein